MKSIEFNDSELESLIVHYERELVEAEKHIAELKIILNKLGAPEKKGAVATTPAVEMNAKKSTRGKAGRPPKPRTDKTDNEITTVIKEKRKSGRPGKKTTRTKKVTGAKTRTKPTAPPLTELPKTE
ncbi:MAG: hypothetical protein WCI71_04895 [Bacteroidota bacterium]